MRGMHSPTADGRAPVPIPPALHTARSKLRPTPVACAAQRVPSAPAHVGCAKSTLASGYFYASLPRPPVANLVIRARIGPMVRAQVRRRSIARRQSPSKSAGGERSRTGPAGRTLPIERACDRALVKPPPGTGTREPHPRRTPRHCPARAVRAASSVADDAHTISGDATPRGG